MQKQYHKRHYLALSAALSLAVHLILLAISSNLKISTFSPSSDQDDNQKETRIKLHTINIRDRMYRRPDPATVNAQTAEELAETIKANATMRKLFEDYKLIEKPKPKLLLSGLGRNVLAPKPEQAPLPQQATAPRPEIVSIEAGNLSAERLANRPVTPQVTRQASDAERLPSLIGGDGFQPGIGKSYNVGMRLSLPKFSPLAPGEMPEDLKGDLASRVGRHTGFSPIGALPSLPSVDGRSTGIMGQENIAEMDQLLTVTMNVYEEPDGGGMFQIEIRPNDQSERLKAIAKDILFLIDCSNSISPSKLEHFKTAVQEALYYLNPRDRFNIVTFSDHPKGLFQGPVNATESNLEQAKRHLDLLQRGGMTDVYAGLAPFVQQSNDPSRPLNVFLMTDGQSTVKNKLDNDTFIRQIAALNQDHVSIYTFSAGKSANLFLLDFLAYTNRGSSKHEASLRNFKDQLVGFISTHSELIISDLDYRITGGMGDTIYPRRLPHLYRGETLSVYGRYPAGTEELAIQIIGRNAQGQLEELIFRGKIGMARKQASDLAVNWAIQKAYFLISQQTFSPSAQRQDEIRNLAKKYNLFIPYL